jgi:hypothetical protein
MEDNGDLAHMDALGFRYYVAAFMHSLIVSPSSGSVREVSTIMSLCPTEKLAEFSHAKYTALNPKQRHAILAFLIWFRSKPDTDAEDRELVDLAIETYWGKYSAEAPNQSSEPTLASGTSPAGQEPRLP